MDPFHFSRVSDPGAFHEMLDVFEGAFHDPGNYGRGTRPKEAYIRSLLLNPDFIGLLAKNSAGLAVGALAAYVLRKFEQERAEIYIYDLAVREGSRRKGVASALIGELKGIGKGLGAYVIFVQADKGQEDLPAQALYRKLGTEEDVFHYDIAVANGGCS